MDRFSLSYQLSLALVAGYRGFATFMLNVTAETGSSLEEFLGGASK